MAADVKTHLYEWSTTEGSNLPVGSTVVSTNLDDNLRMIQKVVRDLSAPTTLAAGTTTDLGSKDETFITMTGTAATVTSFGTVSAGIYKCVVFNAAHVLTHNATSLILPAAANITAADGDVGLFLSLGSGNWRCINYMKANGGNIGVVSAVAGTAAAPGMNFVTDTNSGFYLAAADSVGIAVGGVSAGTWSTTETAISAYTGAKVSITSSTPANVNTSAPNVEITASGVKAASNGGVGGNVIITAGAGGVSTGNGGDITLTAGDSGTSGTGGDVTIASGDNTGGDAGAIKLIPGVGNSASEAGTVNICDDAGNAVLAVNGWTGHVTTSTAPGIPTASGAGTGYSITGSDFAFKLTLGTSPTTTITVTFANAFLAAPVVQAQYQSAQTACRAVSATDEVVITPASVAEGHVIDVICIGTAEG